MTVPPRLSARNLSKRLQGRLILSEVSLDAHEHELVAVLGPSGAGKTTLFRCLTGLLHPDAGSVELDGIAVASLHGRHRRRIGVIFQQFNLVNRLTALENVLAGRLGHISMWRGCLRHFKEADRRLALDCLARVGLVGHAGQRADTLSGGQQQRVAIARALAQQAGLIVADEPVASLDPDSAAAVLALLREIARSEGVAVVCSLHQVTLAREYADRIVGMSHGRVSEESAAAAFDPAAQARIYGTDAAAWRSRALGLSRPTSADA